MPPLAYFLPLFTIFIFYHIFISRSHSHPDVVRFLLRYLLVSLYAAAGVSLLLAAQSPRRWSEPVALAPITMPPVLHCKSPCRVLYSLSQEDNIGPGAPLPHEDHARVGVRSTVDAPGGRSAAAQSSCRNGALLPYKAITHHLESHSTFMASCNVVPFGFLCVRGFIQCHESPLSPNP